NINYTDNSKHGNKVNIITSPRSSGSLLKPLLFAGMLNDGEILPGTLVPDIPTNMTGFNPQNFDLKFDGAVPAKKALSRSLNVPSVRMLNKYSPEKFHYLLQKLGLKTINKAPMHYGLSMILGGAEITLWDITGAYASLSRSLSGYIDNHGEYSINNIRPLNLIQQNINCPAYKSKSNLLNAASIWLTYNSLLEVNRPSQETGWKHFSSSRKIAWKTGTSFGFRDAWAVGTTPEYVVGVWTGNASGEGRPGCVGVLAAAPVMFDIFNKLPPTTWFLQPYEEMVQTAVCRKSGHRPGKQCEDVDTIWIPEEGLSTEVCPYHTIVHLNAKGEYRVKSSCYPVDQMIHKSWFVLPPIQEFYYRSKKPSYKVLPPYKEDCQAQNQTSMGLIYPTPNIKMYLPVELSGKLSQIIFKAVHKNADAQIFWHLNNQYIGVTDDIHEMGISPKEGKYSLILIDNYGNEINRKFEVFARD
ncbi:MAG: penicillin-binding protein 1C, partial [Bacteroidales bacterium]|nr:penicillin-binding protein 1C [Bacteroidales bacterium]